MSILPGMRDFNRDHAAHKTYTLKDRGVHNPCHRKISSFYYQQPKCHPQTSQFLQEQLWPSPEYPWTQVHMNPPGVLVQFAFWLQLCDGVLSVRHSFMSEMRNESDQNLDANALQWKSFSRQLSGGLLLWKLLGRVPAQTMQHQIAQLIKYGNPNQIHYRRGLVQRKLRSSSK